MKSKKLLCLSLLGAACALTSCKNPFKKTDEVGGTSHVQIRCYKGGYDVEWLNELIRQFNNTFKSKGYSAELMESGEKVTETSKQDIYLPDENQTDLYFTNGSAMTDIISQSQNYLGTYDKVLLEELTDVYNSKAIGFDGQEESQTISERFVGGFKELCEYNGSETRWNGKLFKLPWADAFTGLFANKKVLERYGIVDIPLTSNELIAAVNKIYNNRKGDDYPYAFGGNNTSGYFSFLFETWFGQYSTVENFKKFMKLEPADGNIKEHGYQVYQDQGIKKALEGMFDYCDYKFAAPGSDSAKHLEAQKKFVLGKAGFMVNGNWVMQEMRLNYPEAANDIIMLKTPVLSSIGEEVGLTDAQLHDVVKAIDELKNDNEIKQLVTISDEGITRIRNARRVVDSIGPTHDMFIPSYSDAKDAAKLFIRFMYSNDGCNVFRDKAWANLPLTYTIKDELKSKTNAFQASLDTVYAAGKPEIISGSADYNSARSDSQMYLFNYKSWTHPKTYINIMDDKFKDHKFTPQYIFEKEAQYVENNWKTYKAYINF